MGIIAQMLLRPSNRDSFGTTPTTVYNDPSRRMSRPTTPGSALKRVRQNASLSTTTLERRLSEVERRNPAPQRRATSLPDHHQALGLGEWKRTEQNRVDQREDGAVGADAER